MFNVLEEDEKEDRRGPDESEYDKDVGTALVNYKVVEDCVQRRGDDKS